jgi:hypothetical protein
MAGFQLKTNGLHLQGENMPAAPEHNDNTLIMDLSDIGIITTPTSYAMRAEDVSMDCGGIKSGDVVLMGKRERKAHRIFRLGLATGEDGRHFTKHEGNPVFDVGDKLHSVLTPTLLRNLNGSPMRENGRLRVWFSSTAFTDKSGRHTLHETTSEDGLNWSVTSPALLEDVYAPTVLKVAEGEYRMWFADVSKEPWIFRTATSRDGRAWQVAAEPVLVADQPWEHGRFFYPSVVPKVRAGWAASRTCASCR